MTTPQQFLQSFWQAKVDAYADANVRLESVHAKYFGEPLLRHARDFMMRDRVRTVIEDVQRSSDTAVVIAREPLTGVYWFSVKRRVDEKANALPPRVSVLV